MAFDNARDMGRPAANSPRGFVVVLLLAVGLLAACGSDDGLAPRLVCPEVVIVRDAAQVARFRPGAAKVSENLVVRGELQLAEGGCEYDDGEVEVSFSLRVIAERGPALNQEEVPFGYFVAIVEPDGTPWARRAFQTEVEFETGYRRAGSEEELEQVLPVGEGVNAGGYQIVLGFQLTPEELEWNRRPRESPVPRIAP